jgi:hypothetical protein
MTRDQNKYFTYQQASLSQKAAFKIPLLQKLAGTDPKISDSIAMMWFLGEQGVMNKKDVEFILGMLNVLRLSRFATSEKVNEISKLGFLLPKQDDEEDWSEDDS